MLNFDNFEKQVNQQINRSFAMIFVGWLLSVAFSITLLIGAIWALGHFAFKDW